MLQWHEIKGITTNSQSPIMHFNDVIPISFTYILRYIQ